MCDPRYSETGLEAVSYTHLIMPRQKLPVDGLSVVLIAVGLSAFMIGLNEVARNLV